MKIPKGVFKTITVLGIICLIGYVVIIRVMPVFQDPEKETPTNRARAGSGDKKKELMIDAADAFIGDLIMRISAKGQVKPLQEIPIKAFTSGDILSVPVKEGDVVRKNALIIAMDDREYELALKDAEEKLFRAQVKYVLDSGGGSVRPAAGNGPEESSIDIFIRKSKDEWGNAGQLLKSGAITQNEFNSMKRNYSTALALSGERRLDIIANQSGLTPAEIAFERANLNYTNTKLYAPINGRVANLAVQKGQYISSGTEICKIIDVSKVIIETEVLETEISYLELGRNAKITFSALPGQELIGKVHTISPVVENSFCKITIIIDNPGAKIKPGMIATVDIDAQIFKDRLLVPKEAILPRQQRNLVMVIREGRAMWEYVDIGLQNKEFVEILNRDAVRPGEPVAVGNHFTLAHDVLVKIVNKIKY